MRNVFNIFLRNINHCQVKSHPSDSTRCHFYILLLENRWKNNSGLLYLQYRTLQKNLYTHALATLVAFVRVMAAPKIIRNTSPLHFREIMTLLKIRRNENRTRCFLLIFSLRNRLRYDTCFHYSLSLSLPPDRSPAPDIGWFSSYPYTRPLPFIYHRREKENNYNGRDEPTSGKD